MNSFETLWNLLENNERLYEIRNTNELLYNIDINMKKGKLLGELIEMSKVIFEKHGINKDSFHTANIKAEQLKREHNLIDLLDYTADFDKIFSDKPEFLSDNPEGLSVEVVNEPNESEPKKSEPKESEPKKSDPRAVPKVLSIEEVAELNPAANATAPSTANATATAAKFRLPFNIGRGTGAAAGAGAGGTLKKLKRLNKKKPHK